MQTKDVWYRELFCVKCARRFDSTVFPNILSCNHILCESCQRGTHWCSTCGRLQIIRDQDIKLEQTIQKLGDLYTKCEDKNVSPAKRFLYSQQIFILLHEVPEELNRDRVDCRRGPTCRISGCIYSHPGRCPTSFVLSPAPVPPEGDLPLPSFRSWDQSLTSFEHSTGADEEFVMVNLTVDTCVRCGANIDYLPFCVECGEPKRVVSGESVSEPLRE